MNFGGPVREGHFHCGIPKFCIFYLQLIFIYSENFICPAWRVKKFKFGGPILGRYPYFGTPKFCQKLFIVIIINPKNFICLTSMVKKFWILTESFGVNLSFWCLKIWSNIIFLLYLHTLKISCVQLKRLKSLNFGVTRLWETPNFC